MSNFVIYRYTANIPYAELSAEFSALHKYLMEQNMELAICHGDLWQGNILYHEGQGMEIFIHLISCMSTSTETQDWLIIEK